MSDRDALLRAIIAQPDEDTPRLVYADWLDEHGEAKRAAFVRAQIEYGRAADADTATATVCHFLARADRALERAGWAAVDADLGAELSKQQAARKLSFRPTPKGEGVPRVAGVHYFADRGFFGRVWAVDTDAFLRRADDIFRAAPITHLEFDELDTEQAQELVFSGHLARVRSLELIDVEPDALRILGAAAGAAGVHTLELHLGDATPEFAEALAAGRHWTGLRRLEAFDNENDEDAPLAEMLARPQFRGLRYLNMWGAGLDAAAARVIATRLPELRYADLSLNPLGGPGGAALAASKSLKHLRHLNLGTCDLDDGATAATALITAKNLLALTVLNLEGNDFRGLDPKVLSKPGRGPGLRVLDLSDSALTAADVGALASCPAVRGVWHLTLDDTGFADGHAEALTGGALDRLACLALTGNRIGARGARALAAWPGAARLQWLDLGSSLTGEAAAQALAGPHLTGLKYLRATGRGKATLKKRFRKAFAV